MKPVRITWKSTYCRVVDDYKRGTEYRVLFEDIPEYVKEEWLEFADGIVLDSEMENPKLEMQAVLMPNGDMYNIEIKYYFDDYEEFQLEPDDEELMCELFTEFVKANGKKLPDAYNKKTDELLGDLDWEELAYRN